MKETFVTQKCLQVDAWKNSMSAFTDMDNIRVSLLLSHLYSFQPMLLKINILTRFVNCEIKYIHLPFRKLK